MPPFSPAGLIIESQSLHLIEHGAELAHEFRLAHQPLRLLVSQPQQLDRIWGDRLVGVPAKGVRARCARRGPVVDRLEAIAVHIVDVVPAAERAGDDDEPPVVCAIGV
jgi:hypothetical protein